MQTRRKARAAGGLVLAAACCAVVIVAGPGRAAASGTVDYPAESCYDAYVDCGTGSGETDVLTESGDAYPFPPASCRTRWARATRRNFAHMVVFRYYEQVRWCWAGGTITYFYRDRWPADTAFGWSFDGHVASNCTLEHCNNRGSGAYSTNAWTQGGFHVCVVWYCPHKYPMVNIWVNASGKSGASWSGA